MITLGYRIDTDKLSTRDYILPGELRIDNWFPYLLKPKHSVLLHGVPDNPVTFKKEDSNVFVNLEELIPKEMMHLNFALLLQTQERTKHVDYGYLHRTKDLGLAFGKRRDSGKRYSNVWPIFYHFINENKDHRIPEEFPAELIFVACSNLRTLEEKIAKIRL